MPVTDRMPIIYAILRRSPTISLQQNRTTMHTHIPFIFLPQNIRNLKNVCFSFVPDRGTLSIDHRFDKYYS